MKEKCEFCSRKIMFGKKDRTKLIGGELDEKAVMHIGVCDYGSVEDIFEMRIPIRFCPMCGEKL